MIIAGEGKCSCGRVGCFEALASSKGIRRFYKKLTGKSIESSNIYNLALKGDKNAVKALEITGHYLGLGIINVINIFDPELIVLSGSVSRAKKFLVKDMNAAIKKFSLFKWHGKIVFSKNIEETILVGASSLIN